MKKKFKTEQIKGSSNLRFRSLYAAFCAIIFVSISTNINAQAITNTYSYTGSSVSFTIPSCVGQMTITARGAQGSAGGASGALGANGGAVSAIMTATPGAVLTMFVGGAGAVPAGGFNGGGNGGVSSTNTGGGGGGASDVRLNGTALSNRIIVAGAGGGGVGGTSYPAATGAIGGGGTAFTSASGFGGAGAPGGCANGVAGGDNGGVTVSSYGSGGNGGGYLSGGGGAGLPAAATGGFGCTGTLGQGGDGGGTTFICGGATGGINGAGGGGAGYYGGGGGMTGTGGCVGGGGGGSSYANNAIFSGITYTSGNGIGNGEITMTYSLAGAQVSASQSTTEVCPGSPVSLTASGVTSYTWVGFTPGQANITVNPTVTTTYSATGTNTLGCVSIAMITTTVNPNPAILTVVSPTLLCVGSTATITASGASTYAWASGPTTSTFGVNPTTTSVYTVTGTSNKACVSVATVAVNVNSNVLALTSNTSICLGKSIVLVANGVSTFSWSTGSHFQSTPVSPTVTTTYSISGTDVHYCVISNSVTISVNPGPNVAASTNKNFVCKGETVELTANGATTYTWSSGGSGSQINVTLPVDIVHTFTVNGTGANNCDNSAVVTVTVSKCSGINENNSSSSAAILYPNPNNGVFIMESTSGASVEIVDYTGRIIHSFVSEDLKAEINISSYSDGIYYVKIRSNNSVEVLKMIKN